MTLIEALQKAQEKKNFYREEKKYISVSVTLPNRDYYVSKYKEEYVWFPYGVYACNPAYIKDIIIPLSPEDLKSTEYVIEEMDSLDF